MTQEDKELLLKDLCARLPYDTVCQVEFKSNGKYEFKNMILSGIFKDEAYFTIENGSVYSNDYKPYLFPLSSMTEEQKKEISKRYKLHTYYGLCIEIANHSEGYWDDDNSCNLQDYLWLVDWLNKNHFDYRGLIKMGLAIDATGLNIY